MNTTKLKLKVSTIALSALVPYSPPTSSMTVDVVGQLFTMSLRKRTSKRSKTTPTEWLELR